MKSEQIPTATPVPKATTVFNDSGLGINDILDDAMGARPEASERADQIIAESVNNDGAFTVGNTDRNGILFDPAIHEADELGIPRRTADGLFRRKRGRRSGVSYGLDSGTAAETVSEGCILPRTEAVKAGKATAALIYSFGQGVFGDEWTPVKSGGLDEKEYVSNAFADYYEARGCIKLPPEVGLILAVGTIFGPRLFLPQTKAKISVVTASGPFQKIKRFLGFQPAEEKPAEYQE